jgi:hypothetical protein
MTGFDELIGAEPTGAERARLRNVHELLVDAGPPPELTPEMEAGHTRDMTLARARKSSRRRRHIVLGAVAAALVVAIIVPGVGSRSGTSTRYPTLFLRGTASAPAAKGQLAILSRGASPRLKLEVKGLPPLKKRYVVYLVRDGHPVAPCGSFTVSNPNRELTKKLVSPYRLEQSDTWIVTVPHNGKTPGLTVMEPVT